MDSDDEKQSSVRPDSTDDGVLDRRLSEAKPMALRQPR